MSWSKGEKITASKLNSENNKVWKSEAMSSGQDYFTDTTWYSHVPSGSVLFKVRLDCGWFGGGRLVVERLDASRNVVETLYNTEHGWNTHIDVSITSKGPGWYRARCGTTWQFDATTVYWYAFQTNCVKGQKLTLYDAPTSSGNRRAGTLITASALNTGLGGSY